MADYRIYLINDKDRILSGDWIECSSDEEAIAEAEKQAGRRQTIEVWCGDRKVARLGAEPPVEAAFKTVAARGYRKFEPVQTTSQADDAEPDRPVKA